MALPWWQHHKHFHWYDYHCYLCLQCFDTVGWAAGRGEQWGAGVVIRLVWGVHTCIRPTWCHCHSLSLASGKSRLVFTFPVPAHPGSPGQRAVKCVCVCVTITVTILLPSVLWHCWLGVRKSIRPVKIEWWGVGVVVCSKVQIVCIWSSCHPKTVSSLASFKSRLVLPLWYWLIL